MQYEDVKWIDQDDNGTVWVAHMPDELILHCHVAYSGAHWYARLWPKGALAAPISTEKVPNGEMAKETAFNMWKVVQNGRK